MVLFLSINKIIKLCMWAFETHETFKTVKTTRTSTGLSKQVKKKKIVKGYYLRHVCHTFWLCGFWPVNDPIIQFIHVIYPHLFIYIIIFLSRLNAQCGIWIYQSEIELHALTDPARYSYNIPFYLLTFKASC